MQENESVFTDVDATLSGYRAFSPVAFLALIVSLIAASITLVNASLVGVAFFAAAWAAITLFILHRVRSKTGFRLATFALFIALMAASATITYRHYRFAHLSQAAADHSRTWLQMLQDGKIHEPYQLSLKLSKRRKPGTRLASYYGTLEAPTADFKLFLEDEPEKSIREDGSDCSFIRGRMLYKKTADKREDFVIGYIFKRSDPSKGDRQIDIVMRRQVHLEPHGVQWIVEQIVNIQPKINRKLTAEKRNSE